MSDEKSSEEYEEKEEDEDEYDSESYEEEEESSENYGEDKIPVYVLRQVYEHYVKTKTLVIQRRYANIPTLKKQVSNYINNILFKDMRR